MDSITPALDGQFIRSQLCSFVLLNSISRSSSSRTDHLATPQLIDLLSATYISVINLPVLWIPILWGILIDILTSFVYLSGFVAPGLKRSWYPEEPIQPWRSCNDTYFQYSRVIQYPALIWRRNPRLVASMEFTRWVVPICALVFFAFFGLAEEATRNYVSLADKIQKNSNCAFRWSIDPFWCWVRSDIFTRNLTAYLSPWFQQTSPSTRIHCIRGRLSMIGQDRTTINR